MDNAFFILLGLVIQCGQTSGKVSRGQVEIYFTEYYDKCGEGYLSGSFCDPYFTFCLTSPSSSSSSVNRCAYGRAKTSGHFHDINYINLQDYHSIKGIPNPWSVPVPTFRNDGVKLVIKSVDKDLFFDDHIGTLARVFTDRIYPSRKEAKWSNEYTMSQRDIRMRLKIRMYCLENYYGKDCWVFCKEETPSTYTCDPATGRKLCIKGKNCTIAEDACVKDPCHNNGICQRKPGIYDYECVCPDGWEGKNCQISSDPCRPSPCMNNGTCQTIENNNYYLCDCPFPYTGHQCEQLASTGNLHGLPQRQDSGSDDTANYLVVLGVVVLIISILGLLYLFKKRSPCIQKKMAHVPSSPVVYYINGRVLMFDNNMCSQTNAINSVIERNSRQLPPIPTITATVQKEGAVGGTNDDNTKPAETGHYDTASSNHVRAEENPYTDLDKLESHETTTTEGDGYEIAVLREESPYAVIGDVALRIKHEKSPALDATC